MVRRSSNNSLTRKFGKGAMKTVVSTARTLDKAKQLTEPAIDKYLLMAGVNAGTVYGAAELIDRSNYSDPTNALVMMGAGATLAALNYTAFLSNRARPLRTYMGRFNRMLDRSRLVSWAKSGSLAASVAFMGSELNPYFQQVKQDMFPETASPILITKDVPSIPTVERSRPGYYSSYGYNPIVNHDFTGTRLAPKNSMTGRIQRTLRWQPIYRAIEDAHGIPRDTLAGMIMQESYGDPVQPNATNDGGLGVVHIQGTTARLYGLNIYGNSSRDSDRNHGGQIREMLNRCNYDAACAQQYDDRAHMIKVLDTAARIVREGMNKHGSWDHGVEYYRAPGKVGKNLTWRYLNDVKNWRTGIQSQESLASAERDFEERNGYSFDTYISRFHQTADNWGLRDYKRRFGN